MKRVEMELWKTWDDDSKSHEFLCVFDEMRMALEQIASALVDDGIVIRK